MAQPEIVLSGGYNQEARQNPNTLAEMKMLTAQRAPDECVFINRCGQPITRFGIHTLVRRYPKKVKANMPSEIKIFFVPPLFFLRIDSYFGSEANIAG